MRARIGWALLLTGLAATALYAHAHAAWLAANGAAIDRSAELAAALNAARYEQ